METIHAQNGLEIVGQQSSDLDYLKKLCQETKLVNALDESVSSQNMEEGLKFTIAKTQENVQLVKVFRAKWNPENGEAMQAYIHAQTAKGSGIGKIGSIMHLHRGDDKVNDKLDIMASSLAMHIAAMKPTFLKREDIPEHVKEEIIAGEDGEKALKKYIKRDVLWEQELATAEKSETVGRFLESRAKQMKTDLVIKNWALFMI